MKKFLGISVCMAVCLMITSCGVLGIGGSKNGSASVSGQASGAALKSLYTQYQTDGQIDVTNLNNILMLAQLANGIQGLKDVDDKSAFYADFATGLILGSDRLVTKQTANPVTNTLQSLVSGTDLSSIAAAGVLALAQSGANSAQQAAQQNTQQAAQQTTQAVQTAQQATTQVASAASEAVEMISDAKEEVTSTLSSLATIFSLFGN
jgi:hypothetical protein